MEKEVHDNGLTEGNERREFTRIPISMSLKFIDPKTNQEKEALTQDICAKGVGIWTENELPVDATLEIWIEIPNDGQVRYNKGKVVWSKKVESNKYRVGISLEKVDLIGVSLILRAAYGSSWL